MLAAGRDLSEARLSSDGRTVVFVSSSGGRNALLAVPVDGGPERRLSSLPEPRAGRLTSGGVFDWVPDGSALQYVALWWLRDQSVSAAQLADQLTELLWSGLRGDPLSAPVRAPVRARSVVQ